MLVLLFWIYPGRKKGLPSSLVQLRIAVWTGVTRDTRPEPDMLSKRFTFTSTLAVGAF